MSNCTHCFYVVNDSCVIKGGTTSLGQRIAFATADQEVSDFIPGLDQRKLLSFCDNRNSPKFDTWTLVPEPRSSTPMSPRIGRLSYGL